MLEIEPKNATIIKRNNLSKDEALQRVRSQIPMEEKAKIAEYVIDNSSSLDKTKKQVEKIWREFMSLADSE